ncbi:hypothetical protein [Kerstersia gyiorum]|uniref:hypothetical protein n=1 Tax=Kerstersia gyiorum TaxID=206506 RepID=UPI00209FBBC8|nr:hypothetical protein [Kerstersia gyiorum]MCP1678000.1 hypothetical protein [Kerstersia gyiorum]
MISAMSPLFPSCTSPLRQSLPELPPAHSTDHHPAQATPPRRPLLRYQVLPFPNLMLRAPETPYGHETAMPVMSADDTQATDFDGHWKDALEALLAPCVALFWPRLHAAIDWSCPPDFLDKELRALAPGRRRYRRYLDKLVRVRLRSGAPALMLLHLEIQQRLASHFARRMYTYFARLQETFPDSLILQFAIVTRSPRQTSYLHYHYAPQGYAQEGQDFLSLSYRVPVVHLQDWAGREQALLALAPDNPFALVVLAELAAARRSTPQTLLKEKKQLVRQLYQYGWQARRIRQLFLFIDGILALPPELDDDFWQSLASFEEERNMAYISSVERIGIRKGLQQGLKQGRNEGMAGLLRALLETRFGPLSDADLARLQQADQTRLHRWAQRLLEAQTLEHVWH